MEVVVKAEGSDRQYVVDTARREIIRIVGAGRPPSDERVAQILEAAMKKAAGTNVSDAPSIPRRVVDTFKVPASVPKVTVPGISDAELLETLQERASMMREIIEGAPYGEFRAAVIAGGPGMGKSYTAQEVLDVAKTERQTSFTIVQGGRVTPVELFDLLYKYRFRGNVVVLDDSDTLLSEDQSIMLLKAALDSKPDRTLTWMSQGGKKAPDTYTFSGSIIFLTNQDFSAQIDKGGPSSMNKRQQHLAAIRSRCTYLDLMMHTRRAQWLWTHQQITKLRILEKQGLRASEQHDVLKFMEANTENLMEVSIRAAVNMIPFVLMHRRDPSKDWRRRVSVVQFRRNVG